MEKEYVFKLTEEEYEKLKICVGYIEKRYECELYGAENEYNKYDRYDLYLDTKICDLRDRMNFYSELLKKISNK